MADKYCSERGLSQVSLQIAAALMATYIIKSDGKYIVVDTSQTDYEDDDEYGSFYDYEGASSHSKGHLPKRKRAFEWIVH